MKHHNRLLLSTSFYALSLALAPRAMAQCLTGNGTINTPGPCGTAQVLNSPFGTVVSGATLSPTFALEPAYTVESSNATLVNSGTIIGSAFSLPIEDSVDFTGSFGTLIDQGTIINNDLTGAAVGMFAPEATITIGNAGLVEAPGATNHAISLETALGIPVLPYTALTGDFVNNGTITSGETALYDPAGTIGGNFINSGLIAATNGLLANGVELGQGVAGTLDNALGGTISGANAAIEVGGSIGGDLINAGLLEGTDFGVEVTNGLVSLLVKAGISGNFNNSGTITGFNGNPSLDTAVDINGTVGGNVTNSGLISSSEAGFYAMQAGSSLGNTVSNSGAITGADGFLIPTIAGSFENLGPGTITATGSLLSGYALDAGTVGGSIVSAGTMSGLEGIAIGGLISVGTVGGGITNTGVIEGTNYGVIVNDGLIGLLIPTQVGGDFNNSGTIAGTGGNPSLESAVDIAGTVSGNIINSGLISSDSVAVSVEQAGSTLANSVSNSGTVIGTDGFLIPTITGSFYNQAGGTITATGGLLTGDALSAQSVGGSIVNAGTMSGLNGVEIGGLLTGGTVGGEINNSGLIDSTGGIGNFGIVAQTISGDFINSGTILGANDADAVSITSILGNATNSGYIDGLGTAFDAPSITGSFDNTVSGTLAGNSGLISLRSAAILRMKG